MSRLVGERKQVNVMERVRVLLLSNCDRYQLHQEQIPPQRFIKNSLINLLKHPHAFVDFCNSQRYAEDKDESRKLSWKGDFAHPAQDAKRTFLDQTRCLMT